MRYWKEPIKFDYLVSPRHSLTSTSEAKLAEASAGVDDTSCIAAPNPTHLGLAMQSCKFMSRV